VLWVDDDYYEDLAYDSTRAVLESLKRGERPTPGSQTGRRASMAAGGKTTLLVDPHADGNGHEQGSGRRDEEPLEKARPGDEVKTHAIRTERQGRPAHRAGEPAGTDATTRHAEEAQDSDAG
jgi:hypothetical protein